MNINTAKKELNHYIDDLIRENGRRTIDGYSLQVEDLNWIDIQKFVGHLIRVDSYQKEGFEWLMDSDNREIFAHIISTQLLRLDSIVGFSASEMTSEALKFYQKRMQHLIDERIEEVEQEDHETRKIEQLLNRNFINANLHA